MKKYISTILIATFIFLSIPAIIHAAWWNPVSWFSKDKQVERQEQPQSPVLGTAPESQAVNQEDKKLEKINTAAPSTNGQFSDTKMTEDLKTEVATLKASLNNLYKAHNNLVNDYNTLLGKITNLQTNTSGGVSDVLQRVIALEQGKTDTLNILTITNRVSELERKEKITSDQLYGDRGINIKIGNLESSASRITNLEQKMNTVCNEIFGYYIIDCPPFSNSTKSVQDRLKKLETGY